MTMSKRRKTQAVLLGSLFLSLSLLLFTIAPVAAAGFDVSSVLLKVSLNKNDQGRRSIAISSESGDEFAILTHVSGVTAADSSFSMGPGTQTVDVIFDSSGLDPGVYVGSLKVKSTSDEVAVPLIFEVESRDVFFDALVTLPPQSSDLPPGGKLPAQIKIFDLVSSGEEGLGPSVVDVDYFVYAGDGNIVHTESERLSVERQTQISKTVAFPEHMKEGTYVFSVVVHYKSSVGTSSAPFRISLSRESSSSPLLSGFDSPFFLVLASVFAFFVVLVILFVYLIHDRDRFIIDLRKFHVSEMETHHHFLTAQADIIHEKKKTHRSELAAQIREKIRLLKDKHQQQIREMKHLRERGDIRKMGKKLAAWKRAGYNTLGLEYRLKGVNTQDLKNIVAKLKKKYNVTEEYKKNE